MTVACGSIPGAARRKLYADLSLLPTCLLKLRAFHGRNLTRVPGGEFITFSRRTRELKA